MNWLELIQMVVVTWLAGAILVVLLTRSLMRRNARE